MALTKFKLVNTEGLSGLYYKGRQVSFYKIDDKLAEELVDKTFVLERLAATLVDSPVTSTDEVAGSTRKNKN